MRGCPRCSGDSRTLECGYQLKRIGLQVDTSEPGLRTISCASTIGNIETRTFAGECVSHLRVTDNMTTSSKTSCPHCRKELKIRDQYVGKNVKCAACGESFEVRFAGNGSEQAEASPIFFSIDGESLPKEASITSSSSGDSRLPGLLKDAGREPTLEILGRFELKKLLGQGGFGRVYRAYDPQLDRFVALKIPTFAISDRSRVRRFLSEAKAAAQLRHPNIVPTYDSGRAGDKLYIAAQFINGQPLNDRIKNGKVTPREASLWVAKIASAVHYAHEQGIVHRDIKPHNIILDKKNEPQLMDFGLAKRVDEESTMTVDGSLLGTPAYMSPEQARGEHQNVGPASDQYSVGVMLYELLTGVKPFDGAPHSVIAQVITKEPQTIREIDASLPKDLDAICQKAMAKEPSRRYSTTSELADDLRYWLEGRPTKARTPQPTERAILWVRRNPVTAGLSLVLAASLLIGTVVSAGFALHATRQRQLAVDAAIEANQQRQFALNAADEANRQKQLAVDAANKSRLAEERAVSAGAAERQARLDVVSERDRAKLAETAAVKANEEMEASLARAYYFAAVARWEVDRAEDSVKLLEKISPRYRNFEWNLARRQFQSFDVNCYGHIDWIVSAAFSPDGTRIVSGGDDKIVRIWDATTGEELKALAGHLARVSSVTFSPDGARILSGSYDNSVRLWDISTGEELRTFNGHSDRVFSVAMTPDGTRIVSGSADSMVKVWDAGTGAELRTLKGHAAWVKGVAISPDGARIASGGTDTAIRLWDLSTGEELGSLKGHTSQIQSLAFSPDGTRIASGSVDNTVRQWDVVAGKELNTLKGHINWVNSVSYSPDGTQIVSGSGDNLAKLWDASTGDELRTFKGHVQYLDSVTFSPDGTRIASAGGDRVVKIWDITNDNRILTIMGHTAEVNDVAFSPQGTLVVSVGDDETIRLSDVLTGNELKAIRGQAKALTSVDFSPDGMEFVVGGSDGVIKLWDVEKGSEVKSLNGHKESVKTVAFSTNGDLIASGGKDNSIKLWDAKTGEELRTYIGHTGGVLCVTFSPDNSRIASAGGDGIIKLWDANTAQELRMFKGHGSWVDCVTFNSDGTRIASAGADGILKLWDANTGEELRVFKGHRSWVQSVAFNSDGTRIVSGGADTLIKLWDTVTGEELRSLKGHTDRVNKVEFSPDDTRLVSGGRDNTIKLWDATPDPSPHPELRTLQAHAEPIDSVAFAADSLRIFSRSIDGRIIGWECETGTQVSDPGIDKIPDVTKSAKSANGRWLAFAQGNEVWLIDQEFRNSARERHFRQAQAGSKPGWHLERLKLAEEKNDLYSAVFHAASLVALDVNNLALRDRYASLLLRYTKSDRKKHGATSALVLPKNALNPGAKP